MSAPIRRIINEREVRLVDNLVSLYNEGETNVIKYITVLAEIAAGRKLLKDLEIQDARNNPDERTG